MKFSKLFSSIRAAFRFGRCLNLAITPIAVMALALVTFPMSGFADGKVSKGETILDRLVSTDGSQGLVAAIRVVDGSGVCEVLIAELLDNRSKRLVVLAPSNRGFEKFFELPEGGLNGLGSDTIELAFPALLNKLALNNEDICDVLLKHVSEQGNASNATARDLLRKGEITVADESQFPIAIGNVGPSINYAANITERDVFTVNGVIHYIDNVIVEPEEPPGGGP